MGLILQFKIKLFNLLKLDFYKVFSSVRELELEGVGAESGKKIYREPEPLNQFKGSRSR